MTNPVLYLDCDGVLADFIGGVAQLIGKDFTEIVKTKKLPLGWTLKEIFDIPDEEIWERITEDTWANLAPYPWAEKLVHCCEKHFGDRILLCTSAGYLDANKPFFKHAVAGKERWICKYFSQFANRTIIAFNKTHLASQRHILLDDSESNCDKFIANGGNAIVFPQYWNKHFPLVGDLYYLNKQLERVLATLETNNNTCCPNAGTCCCSR